jgi:hypothetical protein
MAETQSIHEAADRLNRTMKEMKYSLKQEQNRRVMSEYNAAHLHQTTAKLNAYSPRCVDILMDIAADEAEKTQVRVSACRSVLLIAGKLTEQSDILDKLDALEVVE